MDCVPVHVQAEGHLGYEPDLAVLCQEGFVNCELVTGRLSPLMLQLRRAGGIVKVKVTPVGELQLSGLCSEEDAQLALKRVARRCVKMGFPAKLKKFRIRSVRWVEAYKPNFSIDILRLGRHPHAELLQASNSQPL